MTPVQTMQQATVTALNSETNSGISTGGNSFWLWIAFVVLGLVTLEFVPGNARSIVIFLVIVGGLFAIEKQGGSLGGFVSQLSNGQYTLQG